VTGCQLWLNKLSNFSQPKLRLWQSTGSLARRGSTKTILDFQFGLKPGSKRFEPLFKS
jgi:hypothetical protein